jgi:RimJ/RimL family protein N-acetyltransferase
MTFAIHLLTEKDAVELAKHSLRTMALSGVAPTPLFWVGSRRNLPPLETLQERYQRAWATPIGEAGWGRCFGLVDSQGKIRGEAGLGSDKLATRSHRAHFWLGLEVEARAQGFGRALLQTVIDWAASETPLAWIDLGVFAGNPAARRLYEGAGFIERGRMVDAFRIDGESIDDIEMTFDLQQYRWGKR